MDELVIFCKSHGRDRERCALLVDSLRRHNRQQLPFYLSVPSADRATFAARLGTDSIHYLSDEELLGGAVAQSWVTQQLAKLRFAELGLTNNYLWIDSDFLFLRDFAAAEFFAYPGVPYTIVSEARPDPFYERLLGDPADTEYQRMLAEVFEAYAVVRDWFGRKGPLYFFGAPAIWSCEVVKALKALLERRGLSFEAMLKLAPYELCWYGEFLLAYGSIPLVPRAGLALCFTRDRQYLNFLAHGFTLEQFAAAGYLAVNFAAKWMSVPGAARRPARRR